MAPCSSPSVNAATTSSPTPTPVLTARPITDRRRFGSSRLASTNSQMWAIRTAPYAHANSSASSPNAPGTAQRHDQRRRHRREQRQPHGALLGVDHARQPGVADPRPPQHAEREQAPWRGPTSAARRTISAEHCVIASTNTRSKNSSSGITRSTSPRRVAVRCGPRRCPGSSTPAIVPCRAGRRTAPAAGSLPRPSRTWWPTCWSSSGRIWRQRCASPSSARISPAASCSSRAACSSFAASEPAPAGAAAARRPPRATARGAAAALARQPASSAGGASPRRPCAPRGSSAPARCRRSRRSPPRSARTRPCRSCRRASARPHAVRALGGTALAVRGLSACSHVASLPDVGCGQSSRHTPGEPPSVSRVAEPAVTPCQACATPPRSRLCRRQERSATTDSACSGHDSTARRASSSSPGGTVPSAVTSTA